ncbi:hypothetical protein DLH72_04180 [Candidatus Gracilibacteria bacterium]|nr:MAG: hypothetical protein DLH72_04180 [Candidatus Gracilibacteria bacterium]
MPKTNKNVKINMTLNKKRENKLNINFGFMLKVFQKIRNKKAFTIVELIITIAILVILATIGFLSFGDYTKDARDSVRYGDLKNIKSAMDFKLTKGGNLPIPDNIKSELVQINGIDGVNWREGVFGEENFKEFEELSNLPLDPKEKTKYKYFLTENGEYYYLETELESGKKYFLTNYETTILAQNSNNQPSNPNPPSTDFCETQTYKGYNLPKLKNGQTINTTKKENKPTNGKTTTRAKANCNNGTITITDENVINIVCNTGYELHSGQCIAEPTDCTNPIYRHDNGVTIKARTCAVAGQEYEFEGEMYYVAGNKTDLKNKINSGYSANKIVTTRVTDMSNLFQGNTTFDEPIGNWDTSNVINMEGVFGNATIFKQSLNNWDTSNVTNMRNMFLSAIHFNKYIGNWDTSRVTDMSGMFGNAQEFNQDIGNWDTSNVTNMKGMFSDAFVFNHSLNQWNVSQVNNMSWMFSHSAYNYPLNHWDVSSVEYMDYIFYDGPQFSHNVSDWNTISIKSCQNFSDGYIMPPPKCFNRTE